MTGLRVTCHDLIKALNNMIPMGLPKVSLDIVGPLILGIDVLKLDKDLGDYLAISTDNISTLTMCQQVYGQKITDCIMRLLNISNI